MTVLTEKSAEASSRELQQARRRISVLTYAVIFLTVAAVGLGAWIVYDQVSGPSEPFLAQLTGSATWVPESADPITGEPCQYFGGLATMGTATGTASNLGAVEASFMHCTPQADETYTGEMTLVADNGDQMVIHYSGPTEMQMLDNAFTGTYEMTVIGGESTGQFANAEGSGSLSMVATFETFEDPAWPATWWIEGTLEY